MTDADLRLAIYQHFARFGSPPTRAELGARTGLPDAALGQALERLDAAHVVVLHPTTRDLWMAMPFSAVPTSFRVEWDTASAWANCAWDALGIPAAIGRDATIRTPDPLTGEPLTFHVVNGRVDADTLVVHFAVPAADWWADIGFT